MPSATNNTAPRDGSLGSRRTQRAAKGIAREISAPDQSIPKCSVWPGSECFWFDHSWKGTPEPLLRLPRRVEQNGSSTVEAELSRQCASVPIESRSSVTTEYARCSPGDVKAEPSEARLDAQRPRLVAESVLLIEVEQLHDAFGSVQFGLRKHNRRSCVNCKEGCEPHSAEA